ncbi:hypothetical protein GK047_16785 [Paenibacillus sp. SYP-B3998]|uniref:Uncharacterized protein n=1 Tax=Paenibacillus sp. SYP-B3998 TaxID=2678564 RepID=A0A6G4A029_9BACL|nr:hypothetical protein [Paenibacillus sp. SYP-B3998]NEW07658.1 hypothetical protein [Paenibacillus sp. SYP-B3998]
MFRIYVIDSDEKTIELSFRDSQELYRFADVFIDHGYKVLIEKDNHDATTQINSSDSIHAQRDERN